MSNLPHSIDAEQGVLGSLMLHPDTVKAIPEYELKADDFFAETHRTLFIEINKIIQDDKMPDIETTLTQLQARKKVNQVGGIEYVTQLISSASSPTSAKQHIEIIKEKSKLRQVIANSNKIIEMVIKEDKSVDDILDTVEKDTLAITRDRTTDDFESSYDVVDRVLENVRKMSESGSSITGMSTGFIDLDKITSGLQDGDLIILGGRPSMGKTAFALSLANNMAHLSQKPVAFFSLEMPSEHLITRILTMTSKLDGFDLRTGNIHTDVEWSDLKFAAQRVQKTPIYIDDSPMTRTSDMFSKCRKLQSDHGLGAIFVDYIQLIEGSSGESRQQQVSDISRQLKALARELDVPVIALSQLSRQVEQRDNKRPMMSDLRESGAIEQYADIIGFLYRDNYYKQRGDDEEMSQQDTEIIELNIAKNRNGATGNVDLVFEKHTNSFYNLDHSYYEK